MKWILPLLTLSLLASCTTKPYMVGSVNDRFYKRHHIPGYKPHDIDYSWQSRLHATAKIPVLYRENSYKVRRQEVVQETQPAYVETYSK
jgi:hypothetical protein